MFNLEKQIAEWRRQMQVGGIKEREVLDELENHLREDIERQRNLGRDAQSAYEAAIQKMGDARLLKGEFMKNQGVGGVFKLTETEAKFGLAATFLLGAYTAGFLLYRFGGLSETTSAQQISGLVALAIMVLLAFGGYLGHRFFPVITSRRGRDVVCISGAILLALWWAAFMWLILPHFSSSLAQIVVVFLWGFTAPSGAFFGIFVGIQTAARKASLPADS